MGRVRVFLVLGGLLVLGLVAAVPWALHERSERELDRPVLVLDHFVSPRTGEVVGAVTSPAASFRSDDPRLRFASPDLETPGSFEISGLRVDATDRSSIPWPEIEVLCPWEYMWHGAESGRIV